MSEQTNWRVTLRIAPDFEYAIAYDFDTYPCRTFEYMVDIAAPPGPLTVPLESMPPYRPRMVTLLFDVREIDTQNKMILAVLSGWEERSPSRRLRKRRKKR